MNIQFALCLPRDEASVPLVRHICRDALLTLGVEEGCVAETELAVTEACTNVLKHAGSDRHEYEVQVHIDEAECQIRVLDAGERIRLLEMDGTKRMPPPLAEEGRGLFLMEAMVDRLDLSYEPQDGTIVSLTKKLSFTRTSTLRELASGG